MTGDEVTQVGPFRETVTEEAVARFVEATGYSPDARDALGVPPTFITRYRVGEFALFEKLGVSLASLLHVEQGYAYRAPIQVGDEIEYSTRLAKVVDKSGSGRKLQFLTLESEFRATRDGRDVGVLATASTVVVVRGPMPEVA